MELSREGGPTARSEAHPLPRNPPGGEDSHAIVEALPLPEICMEEEGLGIELEAQPLPHKDRGLQRFNSLPVLHDIFCSPPWAGLLKGRKPTTRRPLP